MTFEQTIIDGRKVRDLAADLGVECDVFTSGDHIVINFGGGNELCATLEEAVEAVREYAKR